MKDVFSISESMYALILNYRLAVAGVLAMKEDGAGFSFTKYFAFT